MEFLFQASCIAYAHNVSGFQYIDPVPNSSYVSINNKILIRQGSILNKASVNNSLIHAVGTKSSNHTGTIILAKDSRTLIFTPSTPFQTDEEVTVTLNEGLKTADGLDLGNLIFNFHTCNNTNTLVRVNTPSEFNNSKTLKMPSPANVPDTAFQSYLPALNIYTSNNPSPGYILLTPSPDLEIVDNEGTPVFFQNVGGEIYDFDYQPDGELTYFIYPVTCYGMDSSLQIVRTFNTANGFTPDVHDLRVLPDGSFYIFGKRNVYVNMSQYGGSTNADIIDGALQEFDSQGNLIFQWDAIDHYSITDVNSTVDLTQPTIDFSHFNSVEIDTDGNLLVSARNLDEVTKISPSTGNIIWRLGGKNNQFTFINDSIGFSMQHDIRRFSNGDISLFDNGVNHTIQISSAVEYKLDEVNKTATLIYRIYHDNIYSETEGSVQEMPNGNRVICWGENWDPMLTEVTPNDSIAFDLGYSVGYNSYRGFRYQWQTNLFTTNTDTINFGNITVGNSISKQFTIYNPHDTTVTINQFYCSNPAFSTSVNVPITIQAYDSLVVPVTYRPINDSSITTSFNIRNIGQYNGYPQLIARQVIFSTKEIVSGIDKPVLFKQFQLYQNFPNPFNPTTIINYQIPDYGKVTLKVFDILGREIKTLVNKFQSGGSYSIRFDASKLTSGVYFYQLKSGDYSSIKKMVLVK
jgi:hypothetical protein